ncbi:NAD(P)/FAD-dependent oxidoreductase [Sinosporangium siamense]|uniref:FAD/NAD(P)-binding oxidoreductase n=1 Tax=Sinosporangium siamense TaxID=1367973 RepID=A0A919RMC9_9ACTN|nr:NAD(P)/FAD-dependent oxidoreductase [Sinosporangium siamense]GII96442.1 FAD/NAD(P)-binding oxidoreductase [Sinosporangium siamense]
MTSPDDTAAGRQNRPAGEFDVAVVGAGVIGSALAREFALRGASVALLDARGDVGDVTSKANTAILHTGFDAKPGTLESRLVARGHHLLSRYAARAGIPVEETGALLVAWNDDELAALPGLAENAEANGYTRTRLLGAAELRRREPHLGPGALGAMEVPDEGIVCPWTTTLAFATEAVRHSAVLLLDTVVTGAEPLGERTALDTTRGRVVARLVVNAAGLGSDAVHRMFGHDTFTVTPRRGQLIVFDKLARPLVNHVLLPVPTRLGKGVLVAPTVYGNVLLGPTAEDLGDAGATQSTEEGLAMLREKGARILPALAGEEVTTVYAGLRAATEHGDYQISFHPEQGYVCAGGIRSTGLTSSLAVAEHVARVMEKAMGLPPSPAGPGDGEPPAMPYIGQTRPRPSADPARIAADPAYGEVVCFCERVSRGEIRDALKGDIPARSAEGLRRRTRAGMGRCQGFFCGAAVRHMLDDGAAGRTP